MKNVKADDHMFYAGADDENELRNGEIGIDKEKNILVVCCANCGDYSHINLAELKETD